MIIYKITNIVNGKIYIGQTIQELHRRFSKHCSKKNTAIGSAIKKYGKENFKIEIIERCSSIEEMNKKESYYIALHNSLSPNGYNITTGGKNGLHTEETKKKIAAAQKGPLNHMYGKKVSPETLEKFKKRKPRKVSLEERKAISRRVSGKNHPMYEKKHTEETKQKISKAFKGRKFSPETLIKLKQAALKRGRKIKCLETNEIFGSVAEAAKKIKSNRRYVRRSLDLGIPYKGFNFKDID